MSAVIVQRIAVGPETITVLGHKVKATDPSWTGLDLANAEPRTQNTLSIACFGPNDAGVDIHLDVPWCHPADQTGRPEDFDCRYRVRPRMEVGKKWKGKIVKSIAFERWDGQWFIAVTTTI